MGSRTAFVSLVKSVEDNSRAVLMAHGIRTFGGSLRKGPIWLFTPGPDDAPRKKLADLGVEVIGLKETDPIPRYLFGPQVYACARAEQMAKGRFETMVWIDTSCLVVRPPELYVLGDDADACLRPVHIRNVGSPAGEQPDGFWKGIFRTVGVEDVASTVTSFIDGQEIRSYFNTHSFATRPDSGLMARWLELFRKLAEDGKFQDSYCTDDLHRIFLFQCLLSALIVKEIEPARLRILPPDYNYPYNLHDKVPETKKAATLNELTSFTYEGRSIDPDRMVDIGIDEPLKSWLAERI